MIIDALSFNPQEQSGSGIKTMLKAGNPDDLKEAMKNNLPLVYVVRKEDLGRLRMFNDLVDDRGRKHKAKGLSRIMLGRKKIPLVDGGFSSAGRLLSSVRVLLSNAKRDHNLYIIGVDKDIFQALWDHEERHHENKGSGRAIKEGKSRLQDISPASDTFHDSLIRLMGSIAVPPELKKIFIGESKEAGLVRQLLLHAARIDDPVLVLGDTGTGKEIVARQIHSNSARSAGRFITINCGAIAHELFESELFGHKKGAFTGALTDKKGLWREAGSGALFLDEIGDLSLSHQVKILRTLQECKVRPVGDEHEYPVHARIIAATNRDLFSMVQTGQFREDLYYRLRGFLIYTPPLKDHPEDIPLLAKFLWNEITGGKGKELSGEILTELKSYRWPGNVRELKMVLTNLYGLFQSVDRPGLDHLRAIFHLQGQDRSMASPVKRSSWRKGRHHNIDSMRHLRRVYEVIRATEVAMTPVIKDRKTDRKTATTVLSALQHRLDELDALCQYPLRFNDPKTFDNVTGLKSKLLFFRSLLKEDAKSALSHWKETAADQFGHAQSAVLGEIEKLIKASSS